MWASYQDEFTLGSSRLFVFYIQPAVFDLPESTEGSDFRSAEKRYRNMTFFSSRVQFSVFYPLALLSGKNLKSPNSITPEDIKVMRIKEMIANSKSAKLLYKYFL